MDISNQVALVTGAGRGFGRALTRELVDRGARVYAAYRTPPADPVAGAIPITLDVTDPDSIAAAVAAAGDVTLLLNNAGIMTGTDLITSEIDAVRAEFETNFFGLLAVTRAFVPVISGNGGGGILNVLSVMSWLSSPDQGAYAASKSAAWSATNALRVELAGKDIHVAGLHVAYMDTDMNAGYDGPKIDPADVARQAVDGLAEDRHEILADPMTRQVKSALPDDINTFYAAQL